MSAQILIVEEETALAEAIRFALNTDGFAAAMCATGEEALAHVLRAAVDLILLDIGLPDTNGFDLFHRLRALTQAPVIFLTARSQEVDRVAGLELGADDYVTKPFSPRELLARVRTVLRRSRQEPEIEDSAPSPFTVDDERRQIRYFGQTLDLTRYEYGILRMLLRRPGKIYGREELLDQVWQDRLEANDRAVDSHIKTLRAKLNTIRPGYSIIRTHRGLGYALDVEAPRCAAA